MSVANAGAGHLALASCPDYDGPYTVAVMVYVPSGNVFKCPIALGHDATEPYTGDAVYFGSTGNRLYIESYTDTGSDLSGVEQPSGGVPTGEWHQIALRRGAGGNNATFEGLLDGAVVVSDSASQARSSPASQLIIGAWHNADVPTTCRYADLRVWTAALSDSDLEAELASATVVRTDDLWGDWDLPSTSDLTDASGNGRHLSAVGTLTSEDHPTYSGGTVTGSGGGAAGHTSAGAGHQSVAGSGGGTASHTTASTGHQSVTGAGGGTQAHTALGTGHQTVIGTASGSVSHTGAGSGALGGAGTGTVTVPHTSGASGQLGVSGSGGVSASHTSAALGGLSGAGVGSVSLRHTSQGAGHSSLTITGVASGTVAWAVAGAGLGTESAYQLLTTCSSGPARHTVTSTSGPARGATRVT